MRKILLASLLALASMLSQAQELLPNLRLLPGGLQVIERENAATSPFDTKQNLKHADQVVRIDFMDLQTSPQAGKLRGDGLRQEGDIAVGDVPFRYTATAERRDAATVAYTVSLTRDEAAAIRESFISIRMSSSLLDVPVRLRQVSDKGSWTHQLTYPKEHQGGWLWSSQQGAPVSEVVIPMLRGELVVSGLTASAMACKYGTLTPNLRLYLAKGETRDIRASFTVSYRPYEAESIDLRAAMNMGFADDQADDGKGGWTDQGPDNDLRMMTPGRRTFVNVPLEVVDPAANGGRSVIALGCNERPQLPREATIPVGGKRFRRLHFLHADAWGKRKEVGVISVRYTDGTSQDITVTDGKDIANWWDPKSVTNAAVAWQGQNRQAFLGLLLSRFDVQDKPIESLKLTSSGNSVWLVLAIAGSRAPHIPFPEADAEVLEVPVTLDSRDWSEFRMTVARKRRVPGSALDFSFFLDAPAGKHGFVRADGENFVFENRPGVPVRFNGGNLCGDIATRYTHEEADILAELMASYGFNAIRLHHFDKDLIDAAKTDGSVHPERLDHLHYLVSAFKKRGIYTTIDLYTCRTEGFPEPFKGMFDVKSRMVFDKALRDNLMNFARTLLTPVNPYTGLALKDDPALITIGLINEDPVMTVHDQFKYPNADPEQHRRIRDAFEPWCRAHGVTPSEKPSLELYTRFLNDHQVAIYREMTQALRDMGVRQLTSDISCLSLSIYAFPRSQFDYVDNHYYFSHPHALGAAWAFPSSYSNDIHATSLYRNMSRCFSSRILDKPLTITEYNFCAPNEARHEGGLAMGSLSAFQNASGIFVFDFAGYGHSTRWNPIRQEGGHMGWFGVSNDPIRVLSQRIISLLYLRGDVTPAPREDASILTVTPDDYRREDIQGFGFFRSAKDAEIPERFAQLAFRTKIAMTAAPTVPKGHLSLADLSDSDKPLNPAGNGVFDPDNGRIVSSTGEIHLDAKAKSIRVVTPRSEGFLVSGKAARGDRLAVSGSTTLCTVFASAMDGQTLADTRRAIVFHLTDVQPTGRKTTRLGDRFILYGWGKMTPYLLRHGQATLRLRNAGQGKLRINALDVNGTVLAPVPFTEEQGVITFTADTARYGAMAYELVRE